MVSSDLDRLQQLPIEIILNIVIQLGWEPRDIRSLLESSKIIKHIIKTHEEHLSQRLVSQLYSTPIDPIPASSILPWPILACLSTPPLKIKRTLSCYLPPQVRFPCTFPWIDEQEKRNKILYDLSNSTLLNITIPNLLLSLFETPTYIYASHGLSGISAFKSHGLNMLLELSDARIISRILVEERKISINDIYQKLWIFKQDIPALASMFALVWIASIMFDYGDKSTWATGGCKDKSYRILRESSIEDSNILKQQYIYRELVLAHGPYFLWCSMSPLEKETSWVKKMLDEGVEGLKEHQKRGGPVQYSLQSLLLRRLAMWEEWEGGEDVFLAIGKETLFHKHYR